MNKSDLIQYAADKTGISQQQAKECLDATVKLPDGRSTVVLERENVKFKAFQNIMLYHVKY